MEAGNLGYWRKGKEYKDSGGTTSIRIRENQVHCYNGAN